MQTHKPTNPNAASAPPVARPLSDFSFAAQLLHEVKVDPVKKEADPTVFACTKCGLPKDKETGFYLRTVNTPGHKIGAIQQPCKECWKENQRKYKRRKLLEKQNDGC